MLVPRCRERAMLCGHPPVMSAEVDATRPIAHNGPVIQISVPKRDGCDRIYVRTMGPYLPSASRSLPQRRARVYSVDTAQRLAIPCMTGCSNFEFARVTHHINKSAALLVFWADQIRAIPRYWSGFCFRPITTRLFCCALPPPRSLIESSQSTRSASAQSAGVNGQAQ